MCCGQDRTAARAAVVAATTGSADPRFDTVASVVIFEHVGTGTASHRGAVTGTIYRFPRPGDRHRVDPRDRAGLALVPTLRQVR